ncbi:MAG: hypothetical protein JXR48_14600 [Candidatus Delongbacteria bacterium]|nr:hypothetical protein [Candidatus Delongbacteria bacterium]MBN2836186.1 hypothetical protein [Candidatus Delongbacteria bacterium]
MKTVKPIDQNRTDLILAHKTSEQNGRVNGVLDYIKNNSGKRLNAIDESLYWCTIRK